MSNTNSAEHSTRSLRPTRLMRRAIAGAALAGVLTIGSATAAFAVTTDEPSVSQSEMTIVVVIPARTGVPASPEAGGTPPSSLAVTGIDGQSQILLLAAGGLALIAGTALVARRRTD